MMYQLLLTWFTKQPFVVGGIMSPTPKMSTHLSSESVNIFYYMTRSSNFANQLTLDWEDFPEPLGGPM
jgi:hypothetical protein